MDDSLDFNIKIDDHALETLQDLKKATERALYAIGLKAVEGATEAISGDIGYNTLSAVDTGRLRASISFITASEESGQLNSQVPKGDKNVIENPVKTEDILHGSAPENAVVVGSNVEYAAYVHNGTSSMAPRPFLLNGINRKKDEMKRQVEMIFKGEL